MRHQEIRWIQADVVVLMMSGQLPQPPTQRLPTMVFAESEFSVHWPSWVMKSP